MFYKKETSYSIKEFSRIDNYVEYPTAFSIIRENPNETILFNCDCEYDLYIGTFSLLSKHIDKWFKTEEGIIEAQNLNNPRNSFMSFCIHTDPLLIPCYLKRIVDSIESDFNASYSRLMRTYQIMQMMYNPIALSSIKGRYFYSLIYYMEHNISDLTEKNIFECAKYYDWVFLLPLLQNIYPDKTDFEVDTLQEQVHNYVINRGKV